MANFDLNKLWKERTQYRNFREKKRIKEQMEKLTLKATERTTSNLFF